MNLRYLETFVWLTRLKNFGRTAEKLHTTQPAISSRMGKLEEALGVELYRRQAREFELTPSGRIVLGYAEQISEMWTELNRRMPRSAESVTELKVGVIEIGTLSWLSQFLEQFQAEFPTLAMKVTTGTTPSLLRELRDGALDMIFVIGPVNEPNVHRNQICSCAIEWYANPKVFPCDKEIDVVELSHLPIISYSRGSSVYDFIQQYFETYGVADLPMRHQKIVLDCVYSAWSGAHAVRQGLGVMPLPAFLFEKETASGVLARLRVREKMPALTITACYTDTNTNPVLSDLVRIARTSASEFAQTQQPDEFWI